MIEDRAIPKPSEVWMANLNGGIRPILVCHDSPITVMPISSSLSNYPLPTHVLLPANRNGFERDSIVYVEQFREIEYEQLICKVAEIGQEIFDDVVKCFVEMRSKRNTI